MIETAEKYQGIIRELGYDLAAEICRVGKLEIYDYVFRGKELREESIRRLDFLAEVVECLAGAYKIEDGSIRKWFYRKRKQLGNQSPFDKMKQPNFWAKRKTSWQKILSLAKSLRDGGAT